MSISKTLARELGVWEFAKKKKKERSQFKWANSLSYCVSEKLGYRVLNI